MKTCRKELVFNINNKRIDFINITEEVENVALESGVKEGLVLITASVL
jgi:thiamine phosphate synthase YjbQ (UPF0047 family)